MRNHLSKLLMIVWMALALSMMTTAAFAQYENGSLVGTIHDSTGAAIPGASVTATNDATGIETSAKSNSSGDYEFASLRAGSYTVTAKSEGFSVAVAQHINVAVGGRERINLALKAGSTSTTVEVTDIALALETESSQRGQTITNYQTEGIPLVTRNYADLLGLVTGSRQAPTAATTTSVTSLVRQGAYNTNGQRSMFNNFLLDGMDNNAYGESNQGFDNQIISPPPDSISQFEVVTNNESAQYGRSSGATINVASASGGNNFHATLYEFIRNTNLNAAGYFKPTIGSTPFHKPVINRNQFGANFGGPIIKNRLFYFLDYEGFRQTLKPLVVLTVPTQNQLNGILFANAKNPLTGVTYAAGTAIPTTAMSPTALKVIGYFKQLQGLPVSGTANAPVVSNDYATEAPFTDNSDKGDLRLDFQQSKTSSWFLRISDRKETGINYPTLPLPLDGQTNGRAKILDQQIALGCTHTFGADQILDARLGLSRTKAGKYTLSIGNNSFTFPGLPTDPTVAGGLPSIGISGGFSGFGRQGTNPQWQNPALMDPKVNYSWVKGKHSFKFGYEYERIWMAVQDSNPLYGSFSFGSGFSGAGAEANWADFLFGNNSGYALATYFVAHLNQTMHSAYAQDDWRVTPKLTLNVGARWEYGSPYSEQHNHISNFDPVTQTVLTINPGSAAVAGAVTPVSASGVYGKTLVNPDLNDWSPRIGFAYAMSPKTALRGGYGIGYIHYTRAGSGDILAINAPQAMFTSVGSQTPGSATYRTMDQGYPTGFATVFNPTTANITYIPKDTKDSYVQSYFVSLQQQLAKNILLDVAYVGNHGLKLQGFLNANQKNPANGFARPYGNWPSDITEALNGFKSHYDALQIRYEQRFVAGLTLLNSFTWSHAFDNASASLEGNTPSPQDAFHINADWSQSDYNQPVNNVTSLVYDLPFGRGHKYLSSGNPVVNSILGGWQVSAINTMQSGTPFNLTYTPSATNAVSPQISATYRGANEYRPNRVDGVPLIKKTKLANGYIQYVNYAALTLPATKDGSGNLLSPFGSNSRNPGRSPAFYNLDLALNKRFNTPVESLKVEFRSEFYNLFNHTNFYLPSSGLSGALSSYSGTTLTAKSPTGGGTITSTYEPRIIQFGLKVTY